MAAITPDVLYKAWKSVIIAIGGGIGWFVAEFSPTFPLIVVAVVFILYDAYTAYELDKRVHKMYPEKKKREKAHFTSFAFGKVLRETCPISSRAQSALSKPGQSWRTNRRVEGRTRAAFGRCCKGL